MVAMFAGTFVILPASPAAAAPNFKLPFRCGEKWSGQTRTGHSPAYAVDFNRTDDLGDPVAASAPGTVTTVRDLGGTSYGKYVIVSHGGGYSTLYAHLRSFTVSVGDKLDYGTRIGYVGSTGGSTGPHLHYEQRYNGNDIKVRFNGNLAYYWGSKTYTSNNECGANLYSSRMVCGNAFSVIDSRKLVKDSKSFGRVYLLYNADTGKNCTATIKHRSLGSATRTVAYVEKQGGTRATDSGDYGWYAGPVKRYAPGTCIKWGGSVNGVAFNSAWSHCGG